jgi:putative transposase
MLNDKIEHYKKTGKTLNVTPAAYKSDYKFLKEVESSALANVQLQLNKAYQNFSQNKKFGFPKFKSKKRSRLSYTTNLTNGNIAVSMNGIKLPKLGIVKADIHRTAPSGYVLKSATVSMDRDGKYYCSVLYEYEEFIKPVVADLDNTIGLDYKSDGLYMDSNGTSCHGHKYYRDSQKKLRKLQRRLSKKQHGSNNYEKQRIKVAKHSKKTANRRNDFLHKESTRIANEYDLVCVEDLDMKSISRCLHLGKSTMDNGYGIFLNILEYKLQDRGKELIRIDKFYPSSQICSNCGKKHKLKLKDRVYECDCGLTIDRDLNAAINIKKEGYRIYADRMAA